METSYAGRSSHGSARKGSPPGHAVVSGRNRRQPGVVNRTISVSQGHAIAHEVEDTVLHSAPRVAEVLVHVEPDDKDHLAKLRES
jgi:Dimerisation domain of Zinc Transporter